MFPYSSFTSKPPTPSTCVLYSRSRHKYLFTQHTYLLTSPNHPFKGLLCKFTPSFIGSYRKHRLAFPPIIHPSLTTSCHSSPCLLLSPLLSHTVFCPTLSHSPSLPPLPTRRHRCPRSHPLPHRRPPHPPRRRLGSARISSHPHPPLTPPPPSIPALNHPFHRPPIPPGHPSEPPPSPRSAPPTPPQEP